MPKPSKERKVLLDFALKFPGAWEDHPWGENVAKVGKKVFVFLGVPRDGFIMSAKLPQSNLQALDLPFASPTGYGLSRGGWVTAEFAPGDDVPVALLKMWIEESYRAVAPKRSVAELDQPGALRAKPARPAVRKK